MTVDTQAIPSVAPERTTELYGYQQAAVQKLEKTRVGALFMDMGTGKTRTSIELATLRWERVDHVVVCCPVSLKETWRRELHKHLVSPDVHVFGRSTRSDTLPEADWHLVGIESISQSDRQTFALNELVGEDTFLVVDESGYIKNHKALRTQRLIHVGKRARYRLILTGTPISNGVEDLFAQMKFLSPKILGYRSFYSFANEHLEYHPDYPGFIVKTHREDVLAAKMRPYVFQVTKGEALDLPDKIYEKRYCSLTAEQDALYNKAKRELLEHLDPLTINSHDLFRLFTALQQITNGFWNRRVPTDDIITYWSEKEEHIRWINWPRDLQDFPREHLRAKHDRIETLQRVLKDVSERDGNARVIIWARYHYCIRQIVSRLGSRYGPSSFETLHGKKGEEERSEAIDRWKAEDGPRFLVATPETGSHGLNLEQARYAIFYNNSFNYATRLQAEDRIHRLGQDKRPTYIDIVCSDTIDERIMEALGDKEDVLTAFQREVEEVKEEDGDAFDDLAQSL